MQLTTINTKGIFKKLNDSLVAKDTSLPLLVIDYDTIRYLTKNSNTFLLPINSNADSMRLVFATDTLGGADHLVILKYSKELHFISKECGYNYFYTISEIQNSGSLFKQVQVISNKIDDNSEQVHLVFSF